MAHEGSAGGSSGPIPAGAVGGGGCGGNLTAPAPARRRLPPPPHVLIAEYSTGTWVKGKESGNGRWGREVGNPVPNTQSLRGRRPRSRASPPFPQSPTTVRPHRRRLRPDGQTDHWRWEAGGEGWGSPGERDRGCDLGSEPHAPVLGARLSLDTSLSSSPIQSTPVAVQPSMRLPSDSGKAKARTAAGPAPKQQGRVGPGGAGSHVAA